MATVSHEFKQRITDLKSKWFLTEPAYFMILCTHELMYNTGLSCGIAVGGGFIYINEEFYANKTDKFLEESLKAELIRILLKHPYQRQLPNRVKMYLASDMVIANNTNFVEYKLKTSREFFNTSSYDRECFEGIYDAINIPDINDGKQTSTGIGSGSGNTTGSGKQSSKNNSSENGENENGNGNENGNEENDPLNNFDDGCSSTNDAYERTQYWKEDDYRNVEINNIIGKLDSSNSWGTIPGNTVDTIKKSIEPRFNYKALFQQFRSTVISSKRDLTRMKPNRRFGYLSMGSKRQFTTKILVCVDTSGSISDSELALAMGFINNFFKYGVETVDAIQFDTKIYEESLEKLSKKMKRYKVHGRGGTDFDDCFSYAIEKHPEYNGVIIFTDGWASCPDSKWLRKNYKHTKFLWVLNNKDNYEHFKNKSEFMKFGKCTYVDTK